MSGPTDDEDSDATAAARDWILRLSSGEITPAEMSRFKEWLARSPARRAAFERERRFWRRLEPLRQTTGRAGEPDSRDEAAPAGRASPSRSPRPAARRGRRAALVAGLAACAALALAFGDLPAALMADYTTAVGARRTVTLADGSVVHLNTDTAIAVAIDAASRRVDLLRGEALFEVAADPARPFSVAAGDGVTRALGTAFVVRTGDGETTVTVTEGRVRVTAPAGAGGAWIDAGPGARTRYRAGQAPRSAGTVDPAMVALWRRGVIRIDDLPLDAAVAELDRYRPGRIVLLADGPYESVSGAFDIAGVDAAVAGLAATHGLGATEITPYLLVLR